jgi:hypothetical protein
MTEANTPARVLQQPSATTRPEDVDSSSQHNLHNTRRDSQSSVEPVPLSIVESCLLGETDSTRVPLAQSTEQTPFNPSGSGAPTKADRWHILYRVPLVMIVFLLLGIAFVIAHHCYYNSLNSKPVEGWSQEWAFRIGTGLAFLARACLIASAALSFQQHYWRVLRDRPISIQGINDVMGLLANPICFLNLGILRKAWSSVVIALAIWYDHYITWLQSSSCIAS